eukprot:Plantae.Rhodophyta-Purpureofilum_apyrenoidigerum.ctg7395.p1 GENE.Plantae.Rhodophyta-Purpureofilum_apyrenoidigerum.ctg7395~~Plantae.Rhodophyta-Purpureofilum_apyrenoidigerum.ctg7395.p1  ORF type:complete len:196 (-),score=36.27 Plantae.Rhodophyta-Purpureofilum_apyrenoidigerum.ctg7395:293-880(-)
MTAFVGTTPVSTRTREALSTCICNPCTVRARGPLRRNAVLRMTATDKSETDEKVTFSKLKEFLEDTKKLGRLRMIAQNEASVMEAIAPTDGLFYAVIPNGIEYGNIIDPKINLDLHLKLSAVGGARFENGTSRGPTKATTYIVRLLGKDLKTVVLSLFVQWDKDPNDIGEDRISAWKDMKNKYAATDGDTTSFNS